MQLDLLYNNMSHYVDILTTIINKYPRHIWGCILLETWWSKDENETDEDGWCGLDTDELFEWVVTGKNTGI